MSSMHGSITYLVLSVCVCHAIYAEVSLSFLMIGKPQRFLTILSSIFCIAWLKVIIFVFSDISVLLIVSDFR